jgi:hypothetical protein
VRNLILEGVNCGTFIPYGPNSLYVHSTKCAIGIITKAGIFILGLQTTLVQINNYVTIFYSLVLEKKNDHTKKEIAGYSFERGYMPYSKTK